MLKVYLAYCGVPGEHEAGVKLAKYAIDKNFGHGSTLSYTERGKPVLDISGAFVSISHSHRLCAAAVSDSEIGIDIELADSLRDVERIARRFFAPDEMAYVLAGTAERFYEIWTAKESYIKFTGEGLSRGLGSFSILSDIASFGHFAFSASDGRKWAGCVCSANLSNTADIMPTFVDIDEI